MARPLIVIPARHSPDAKGHRTAVVSGGRLYADALERAGAVPLYLPPSRDSGVVEDAVDACDGLLLLGGGDVSPARYGSDPGDILYSVDEDLDEFEITAVLAAIRRDVPVLAVCRGLQVLNVALGGTLHQHIGDGHRDVVHRVDVDSASRIGSAIGDASADVHCFHHQAIDRLAPGLRIVATHPDGTVEAVEHESASWVAGTQWHPEDTAGTDPVQQRLFGAFVRSASRR